MNVQKVIYSEKGNPLLVINGAKFFKASVIKDEKNTLEVHRKVLRKNKYFEVYLLCHIIFVKISPSLIILHISLPDLTSTLVPAFGGTRLPRSNEVSLGIPFHLRKKPRGGYELPEADTPKPYTPKC
jgi:hypothetical protein